LNQDRGIDLLSLLHRISFHHILGLCQTQINIRIVWLLLEDEESVQAEAHYNYAALLIPSGSDHEITLQFKLCQARISNYNRKFLKAAGRYHELSYVGEIDEEECHYMLYGIYFNLSVNQF